jgi:hypothetical protein
VNVSLCLASVSFAWIKSCALTDVAHPASTQTVTIHGAATFKSVPSRLWRLAARVGVDRRRRGSIVVRHDYPSSVVRAIAGADTDSVSKITVGNSGAQLAKRGIAAPASTAPLKNALHISARPDNVTRTSKWPCFQGHVTGCSRNLFGRSPEGLNLRPLGPEPRVNATNSECFRRFWTRVAAG